MDDGVCHWWKITSTVRNGQDDGCCRALNATVVVLGTVSYKTGDLSKYLNGLSARYSLLKKNVSRPT